MNPRRIYDQPISNFPSSTWLREMADQEHEHDPLPSTATNPTPASTDASCALAEGDGRPASVDAASQLAAR